MAHAPRIIALASFVVAGFGCGGGSNGEATASKDGGLETSGAEDAHLDSTLGEDGRLDAPSSDSGSGRDALADAGAGGEAGPCGVRAGQRGLSSRSMTVAGLNRTYLVYLPPPLDPRSPIPLVFVLHGYTMSGQDMYNATSYAALADNEGIAVVFPDGESGPNSLGAPWNVGTGVCPPGDLNEASGDDFDFLSAMQADVEQDQCIDLPHVFLAGFSMGGYFAHHLGCMRPDLARAVAPCSGGTHDFSGCVAGHKPVIIVHGDSDPVIPLSCDTQAASQWVTKNGCSTTTTTDPVDGGACQYYQGCPADGQVAICIFNGMGHCWAGGAASAGVFSCPGYASATEIQWAFFKKYAW